MVVSVDATPNPHVAILASPGKGHLIPILELAKRLVSDHHFTVAIYVASLNHDDVDTSSGDIHVDVIPLPATSPPPDPSATILRLLSAMMRSVLPELRSALTRRRPAALVVDLFGTEALGIATELGVKKYVFCTSNAWFLAETLYVPALDKEIRPGEVLTVPGCKGIRYEDLIDPVWAWGKPDYAEYARMGSEMVRVDGILVNTWEDLDPTSIYALRSNEVLNRFINMTLVHPIGPLTRPPIHRIDDNDLLAWLDVQSSESVLYVSFGSGGTLSVRQTVELAWGLVLSQQRFVWVIRPPLDREAAGSLFNSLDGPDEISRIVPDGFLEQTQEVGTMVLMWAPQSEVLAHGAVGGFLTHCGWNSTLESLTNGVPMIVWPLYAEQSMNATFLCEEVEVAVRPEVAPTKEVVGREEIARMVREVMAGGERGRRLRERAKELRASTEKAVAPGGSSSNSLAVVVKECEDFSKPE